MAIRKVLKTFVGILPYRGFESHPHRQLEKPMSSEKNENIVILFSNSCKIFILPQIGEEVIDFEAILKL